MASVEGVRVTRQIQLRVHFLRLRKIIAQSQSNQRTYRIAKKRNRYSTTVVEQASGSILTAEALMLGRQPLSVAPQSRSHCVLMEIAAPRLR